MGDGGSGRTEAAIRLVVRSADLCEETATLLTVIFVRKLKNYEIIDNLKQAIVNRVPHCSTSTRSTIRMSSDRI